MAWVRIPGTTLYKTMRMRDCPKVMRVDKCVPVGSFLHHALRICRGCINENAELALDHLMLFCSGLPLQAVFWFICRPFLCYFLGFFLVSWCRSTSLKILHVVHMRSCSYEELLCVYARALLIGSQTGVLFRRVHMPRIVVSLVSSASCVAFSVLLRWVEVER